jgi:hypothetical protein
MDHLRNFAAVVAIGFVVILGVCALTGLVSARTIGRIVGDLW